MAQAMHRMLSRKLELQQLLRSQKTLLPSCRYYASDRNMTFLSKPHCINAYMHFGSAIPWAAAEIL